MTSEHSGEAPAAAVVRRAAEGDLSAVARLRWAWRVGAGEVPPSTLEAFTADLGAWLAARPESHVGFVAESADGEVVGIAFLAVVERVPGPEVWTRLSGYVQSVYVDPAHRGHGTGERLVQALIDAARALGLQYVAVNPSAASFPLYERVGFVANGRTLQLRL